MKAVVFTLGCKVNSCESASLMNGLKKMGYEVSDKLEFADIYVLNTCAVTSEAEKKSRQLISRVRKFNSGAPIYVLGCASQNNPDAFLKKEGVKLVLGTASKDRLLSMLEKSGKNLIFDDVYFEEFLQLKQNKTRSYIKIQDGCDNFCSYCLIPYVRGRSKSRPLSSIIEEIEHLNPKEIILSGINLSAYNYQSLDLAELLEKLKDFDVRIRLGSLEAVVIDQRFLNACKRLKRFAPHFHLSLQSASNNVLEKMNRRYTIEEYFKKVNLIREYFPNSAITTDIIVGFYAESDEDFELTYEWCKKIAFSDIHCFPYSERKGTKAFGLKGVSDEKKSLRLKKMLELKRELKQDYINKFIGLKLQFIAEEKEFDYYVGYSENYIRLYFSGDEPKDIIEVTAKKAYLDGLLCEI